MGGSTCINVSYLVHVVYKQIFFTLPFKVECFVNSGPMETVCCVKSVNSLKKKECRLRYMCSGDVVIPLTGTFFFASSLDLKHMCICTTKADWHQNC